MQYPSLEEYKRIIQEGTFEIRDCSNLHLFFCDEFRCGDRSVVFKMHDKIKDKDYALKCYLSDSIIVYSKKNYDIDVELVGYRESRYCEYENYFAEFPSYITPFKHITLSINSCLYTGNVFAILMDWVDGQTLKDYLNDLNVWIPNELERHQMVYLRFVQIASELIESEYAHGNIKLDNIIIQDDNDIKLVGYDNMYIPSLKGEQSYFNLIGIKKSRIEEYSFLGDSEEAFHQAKLEDRVQQYDEYMDLIPLLWITINLKFYLNKSRNSTLAPFLFGRGDTAMLFPCGMNLLDNDQNIIEQLILIGEQHGMGALLSLYLSALNLGKIKAESYVIAALNIAEIEKRIIDNYYQLDSDYSSIRNSYYIESILEKNSFEASFSLQELLIYKDILRWDAISRNRNIEWSRDVIEKLKYYINWTVFVQNQELDFLSDEKKSFLRSGCLWVNRYFESLECLYFDFGKKELGASDLKQEMFFWFWNFTIECFDEKGNYFYSVDSLKPVLCKYWVNASNYDNWYQRRLEKKTFCLPVEFILAFTYYEDNFESDFNEYPTIEVKGVTKHYGDMYEDWEELETESVDKLVNSYLCLDEQVCINYELIRYWIDQEALNTQCWKALSANRNFIKSDDIIESFVDYWDWSILCDEENLPVGIWTVDFLQNYKDRLDWNILSDKKQIGNLMWNGELLNLFVDKWNWYVLCNNQSETLWTVELYQMFKDKWIEQGVSYPIVYNKLKNERSDIEKSSERELERGQNFVCNCNINQSVQFIHDNFSKISKSSLYGWNSERLNSSVRWSYTLLSVYGDKWSWTDIQRNKEIPWKLSWLVNFQDRISWKSYDGLYLNPYIPLTPQILNEIEKEKISSWQLCDNSLFVNNVDLLAKYWDENVITSLKDKKRKKERQNVGCDINSLLKKYSTDTTNKNTENVEVRYFKTGCSVSISDIEESLKDTFESKYGKEKYLDWSKISNDKYLIWSDKFILEHKEQLEWGKINWDSHRVGREGDYEDECTVSGLCANPAIHWSKERLQLFKDSVVWNVLAAREDIKVPWFCANEQLRKEWYEKLWKDIFPWMESYNDVDIKEISIRQSIYWGEEELQAFNWIYDGYDYLYRDESDIMRLFWKNISNASNVHWSVSLIQKYIQRWDWEILSNNQAVITQNDILTCFEKKFNWKSGTILKHLLNHWDSLELYKDLVDWNLLCRYYWVGNELFLEEYANNIDWTAISENVQNTWSVEFIVKYENYLDWDALSSNSSVFWDMKLISRYEDKIKWDKLVGNKGVRWSKDIIEKYHSFIDINVLYDESKFPWDFVVNSSLIEVDWRKISQSSVCTHNFVQIYKKCLNWNDLSRNKYLLWTMDFINEFSDYWNYALLSANEALPWSEELIDKYIDRWNWNVLPLNNAVSWNEKLVCKYFSRLIVRNIKRYATECKEGKECRISTLINGRNFPCYAISDRWELIVFLETVKRSLVNSDEPSGDYCNYRNIFETVYDDLEDESYNNEDDYQNDWGSAYDNPYYNDNLDMDQQSPEFWDNL